MNDKAPETPSNTESSPLSPTRPTRPTGPNASAIIVGLVAMVLGALVIAEETRGMQVDWSRVGPVSIIGIGVVMVLLGAVGLVRRRDHL